MLACINCETLPEKGSRQAQNCQLLTLLTLFCAGYMCSRLTSLVIFTVFSFTTPLILLLHYLHRATIQSVLQVASSSQQDACCLCQEFCHNTTESASRKAVGGQELATNGRQVICRKAPRALMLVGVLCVHCLNSLNCDYWRVPAG